MCQETSHKKRVQKGQVTGRGQATLIPTNRGRELSKGNGRRIILENESSRSAKRKEDPQMNPTISAPRVTSAGCAQSLEGYLRRVLERIEDEQRGAQEPGRGPGAPQTLRRRCR